MVNIGVTFVCLSGLMWWVDQSSWLIIMIVVELCVMGCKFCPLKDFGK